MPVKNSISIIFFSVFTVFFVGCKDRFQEINNKEYMTKPSKFHIPKGMVWVEAKTFFQGAKDSGTYAMPREKPAHYVTVDGFKYISPIKSYEPNSIGLYDMSGNVWEITSDYFNVNYYQSIKDSKS
tara:strand:- start:345 stop:722 length:378 start_codon:yes stop_codon:yes gene_type:complete